MLQHKISRKIHFRNEAGGNHNVERIKVIRYGKREGKNVKRLIISKGWHFSKVLTTLV